MLTPPQEQSVPATPRRPSPKKRRWPLWAGVAVAVIVIGGVAFWQRQRASTLRQQSLATYVVKAERGSLPGIVTASGELEAARSVNVSPKRGGVLADLFVDEGDLVRAGEPIALMDSGDLRDRENELLAQERQAAAEYARSR